jgi:hypothetical protein
MEYLLFIILLFVGKIAGCGKLPFDEAYNRVKMDLKEKNLTQGSYRPPFSLYTCSFIQDIIPELVEATNQAVVEYAK